MYSDSEEHQGIAMPVAAVTVMPSEKIVKERQGLSITIGIAVLASILFPPLGVIALILAVIAWNSRNDNFNESERFRRISGYFSLAAFLASILLFVAILMVAFANRGSDIYVRPPGVEPGRIFWQSGA